MSDSPLTADSSRPEEDPNSLPHICLSPSSPRQEHPDSNSEAIKEKFLAVAKEKMHLESVVKEQRDMIKRLDGEKTRLSLSLKTLTEGYNQMQSLLLQESPSGQQKKPLSSHGRAFFFTAPKAQESRADAIRERFLAVAKEKSRLDAVMIHQHDMIRKLEEENADLSLSFKTLTESHEKMKEKLLDFDLLRNREIAELKQIIERLIAENKKLVSEKDLLLRNGGREGQALSLSGGHADETLRQEKEALEVRLQKVLEDLNHREEQKISELGYSGDAADLVQTNRQLHDAVASLNDTIETLRKRIAAYEADLEDASAGLAQSEEQVRTLEHDEALLKARLQEAERGREEIIAELSAARSEIDRLRAEKSLMEENHRQAVHGYGAEISALKGNIAELTDIVEKKMQDSDEAHRQIALLTEDLSLREGQLHGKVPSLLDNMDCLSRAIDGKTEELSRFAGDLAFLKEMMTSLGSELVRQEEFLHEIAGEYTKQQEQIAVLHDAYGQTEQGLLTNIERMKQEGEELRTRVTETADLLEKGRQERQDLERQLIEAGDRIAELQNENAVLAAGIAEKGKTLSALQRELDHFSEQSAEAEKMHATHLSALQEKVVVLDRQLLEKHELLTALSSEQHHDKEALSSLSELFRSEKAAFESEAGRLRAEIQDKEENLVAQQSLIEQVQQEKANLESRLEHAAEKIRGFSAEQDRLSSLITQKEEALSLAETEASHLRAAVERMQGTLDGLEKKIEDEEKKLRLSCEEKEELLRSSREYQDAYIHLKEEIVSLNQRLAAQETRIGAQASENERLLTGITDLQGRLEQSRSALYSLETLTAGREASAERVTAEKNTLLDAIEKMRQDVIDIEQEKGSEIRSLKEELSVYGKNVTALEAKLEQSIRDNEALRVQSQVHQKIARLLPAASAEKQELALPARVVVMKQTEKAAPARQTFGYALLALVLIAGVALAFYAYNTGYFFLPNNETGSTVQEAGQRTDLPYIDMLSLLTRSSSSDALKFHATLLTESLVLKSDEPGDASLFDFRNEMYFRITISLSKGILHKDLTTNPHSHVMLVSGRATVSPRPGQGAKAIRIFYKKDDPVSLTFYCAFPRNILDADSLSLALGKEASQATLTWDLRALRNHHLIR